MESDKEEEIVKPKDIIEFAERCLQIKLWVTQKAILKAFYTLPLEPEEREILCEWRKQGKTNWSEGCRYNELVLVAGMRGSKTSIAGLIGLWEAESAAQLGNPALHYGLLPGQELFVVNVATSKDQAKDTVFAKMEAYIENSPYYKQLMEDKQFEESKAGEYRYPEQNIILRSEHSNSASLVGKTAKCVIFDELARFQTTDGKYSGNMVYTSLSRATKTLRQDGKTVSISSPMFDEDAIMNLYNLAMDEKRRIMGMLAFKLATWELNPMLKREDFDKEYAQDPEAAERDYGANPPSTVNQFFEYPNFVEQCFVNMPDYAVVETGITTRYVKETGEQREFVKLDVYNVRLDPNQVYYAFVDASEKQDSYALAIGHGEPAPARIEFENGDVIDTVVQKPIIDLLLQWVPQPQFKRPVDVLNVIDTIKTLSNYVYFKKIIFDKFNAPNQVQSLLDMGIDAEDKLFSSEFQYKIYSNFKKLAYMSGIEITNKVNSRESAEAFEQLKFLKLVGGKKITHKERGKDLADVIAGLAWLISSAEAETATNVGMPEILPLTIGGGYV